MSLVQRVEMVNPLAGRQAGQVPDEQQHSEVISDGRLEEALAVYERFYQKMRHHCFDSYEVNQQLETWDVPVLDACQIQVVATKILSRRPGDFYAPEAFLNRLIQESYNVRSRGFVVAPVCDRLMFFGLQLRGKDKLLELTVQGSLGGHCGTEAHHVKIRGNGASDHLGLRARDSVFIADDDVGTSCGRYASDCVFDVAGLVGDGYAEVAERCTFILRTPFADCCGTDPKECTFYFNDMTPRVAARGAYNCTFRTWRPDVYKKMRAVLPSNNKVELIARMPTLEEVLP